MRAERIAHVASLCTGLLSKTGLGSTQALQQPVLLTVPPGWGHGTTFKNDTVYHNYIAEHFFHALLEAWSHEVQLEEPVFPEHIKYHLENMAAAIACFLCLPF